MQISTKQLLPFKHLNLRFNPFGELSLAQRKHIVVAETEHWIGKLEKPGFAVQFLGESGRGKTSHLLSLLRHFPNSAYVHVLENEQPFIPDGSPLFIDEAQWIPVLQRRRLFQRPISFVVGSHKDHSRELIKAGLKVRTHTLEGRLTTDQLSQICRKRIEFARRGSGAVPRISQPTLLHLMRCYQDDIRSMEDELYEKFQKLEEVRDV